VVKSGHHPDFKTSSIEQKFHRRHFYGVEKGQMPRMGIYDPRRLSPAPFTVLRNTTILTIGFSRMPTRLAVNR